MICGKIGQLGVCVLPRGHRIACEPIQAKSIHMTREESRLARFTKIVEDLAFVVAFATEQRRLAGGDRNTSGRG